MSTEVEIVDLTEIVGEVEITCDYSQYDWCPKGAARWAVRMRCPACKDAWLRLLCDCKDFLMVTDGAFGCLNCDTVIVPARHMITSIEPIDRKTA